MESNDLEARWLRQKWQHQESEFIIELILIDEREIFMLVSYNNLHLHLRFFPYRFSEDHLPIKSIHHDMAIWYDLIGQHLLG